MTAKDTQVNKGGHFEAKGQRHHEEVEGIDAIDLFERVGVIRPDVGLVGLLSRLVQVVVLLNQFLQLRNRTVLRLKSTVYNDHLQLRH